MTDSLGIREISCQQNEQHSHETTALKVEKAACHRRGIGPRKSGKLQDQKKKKINYGKKKREMKDDSKDSK